MYFFLTSGNHLCFPDAEICPVSQRSFDPGQLLDRLRRSYTRTYRDFVVDRKKFEQLVADFSWYAERISLESVAEFFFNVRVYESVFFPEFEKRRRELWEEIVPNFVLDRSYIKDFKAGYSECQRTFLSSCYRISVAMAPPGLFLIEHLYSYIARIEKIYLGKSEVKKFLEDLLASAGQSDTQTAKYIFEVFQHDIPIARLIKLIKAARMKRNIDDRFDVCRAVFFDRMKTEFAGCRALTFEQTWCVREDIRVSLLKARFIDLLIAVFESHDVTDHELHFIIKTHETLYKRTIQENVHGQYTHMAEGLRSGFPFGPLGDATRKILHDANLFECPMPHERDAQAEERSQDMPMDRALSLTS